MLKFKEFTENNEPEPSEEECCSHSIEQNRQDRLFDVKDYHPHYPDTNGGLVESVENHPENAKRLLIKGTAHQGKAIGVSVPRHMWEGTQGNKKGQPNSMGKIATKDSTPVVGMNERNKMRAAVYGSENREPLTKEQIHEIHKKALEEHFAKPKSEQVKAENEALNRLKKAGHISSQKSADTTDESEKTDTVNFETDHKGRFYSAAGTKGVAGHAVYTSGTGENEKHHIINTCKGQTEGCGGGVDENGIADSTKGSCFAPNAESQYPSAAVRRACHEQAKHDPAMTKDWIIAHTGGIRNRVNKADIKDRRFVFRPNITDETDTTSRLAIKHLNKQRKQEADELASKGITKHKSGIPMTSSEIEKPRIESYGYGKTGDIHDPENGWHSTYSNTGPKVKDGKLIKENRARDSSRIAETVMAQTGDKHHTNDEGEHTPPKNSYMVINAKRGSQLAKDFEHNVTHAKYWSRGREQTHLSPEEKAQGAEGHYDGNGQATTPENAHYGHITLNGRRYDYQKQHLIHPRLVDVPITKTKKGVKVTEKHSIPSDSRFKDNDYYPPENERFRSRNGKVAGGLLATTPTESTTDAQHHTNFTHHVDDKVIAHAQANNGEYEIDAPHEQEKARTSGEYAAPHEVTIKKKSDFVR